MFRVTFGIIVLNGEPFTRYCLRAVYPFAHEIIVVEGAAPGAATIATPNGHSTDGTLDVLKDFKAREDPEDKFTIVVAEDEGYSSGFWPGEKHEQSQAYAKRATGDYLWQVDIDEFYKAEDMTSILNMLRSDPEITQVNMPQLTFWGGFDYLVDGFFLRSFHRSPGGIPRIFKWGPYYRYVTHRPPTVKDPEGRDLRNLKWVTGNEMTRRGVFLYHYSLVFPKQVLEKCAYYGEAKWASHARNAERWAQENFMELKNPFRVHNVYQFPSWLDRFRGEHPSEIVRLQQDIHNNLVHIELRRTDDVKRLLSSPTYKMERAFLKWVEPLDRRIRRTRDAALKQAVKVKRLVWHAFDKIARSTS